MTEHAPVNIATLKFGEPSAEDQNKVQKVTVEMLMDAKILDKLTEIKQAVEGVSAGVTAIFFLLFVWFCFK